nr:MAG TPA: NAD-reducing hydrogenase, Ni-Fe, Fe-S, OXIDOREDUCTASE [Caudoviricetes sp.]
MRNGIRKSPRLITAWGTCAILVSQSRPARARTCFLLT